MYKNMFLYEITHRYLKNDYQFFDTLKTKHRKIRGNCNLSIKVKFHKLERSTPLISFKPRIVLYTHNTGICRKLLVAKEGRLPKDFYIHIFTDK